MIWIDPTNAFVVALVSGIGWTLGRIAGDLIRRFGLVVYNALVRWSIGSGEAELEGSP